MRYSIYYDLKTDNGSCFQRRFETLKEAIESYNKDNSGKIVNDNMKVIRRFRGFKNL